MGSRQKSIAELAAEMQVEPLDMGESNAAGQQEDQPAGESSDTTVAATAASSSDSTAGSQTPARAKSAAGPATKGRLPNPSRSSDGEDTADKDETAPGATRTRTQQRVRATTAPPRRSPISPAPRRATMVGPGHRTPKGMERKDVPFWIEDLDAVEALAKALNRQRGRGIGERITYAVLVRVAVKGLLAFQDQLDGRTERELSLGFLDALGVSEGRWDELVPGWEDDPLRYDDGEVDEGDAEDED